MNTNRFTSKEARDFLDEELGPGNWEMKRKGDESARLMMWQQTRGWDIIRVMDYKDGVIVESQTRKNTHNYCETLEDLEFWCETYLEQEDYGLQ